jgi:hypothetical protein
MGRHRRQMREQSPREVLNNVDLVLPCNLDLSSDNIKIFTCCYGNAVVHEFTCVMGSATAEDCLIVHLLGISGNLKTQTLPLTNCTSAVLVHGRHKWSLSLISWQENISSIYLTAAV